MGSWRFLVYNQKDCILVYNYCKSFGLLFSDVLIKIFILFKISFCMKFSRYNLRVLQAVRFPRSESWELARIWFTSWGIIARQRVHEQECFAFCECSIVEPTTDILSVIRNLSHLNSLITGKTSSIASALPCWCRLASILMPVLF